MNLMAQILINVIIAFLAGSLLLGFHRKVMARVQLRPGPPIIQYLLHSLKFFFKETTFPKTASIPFYIGITVILAGIWVTGVIVGPVTKGSLMILFGIYAIHKIVEHNAGSSSGSPYGKVSCVRAVFSAAGELPLFAVIAVIFLLNVQVGGDLRMANRNRHRQQRGADHTFEQMLHWVAPFAFDQNSSINILLQPYKDTKPFLLYTTARAPRNEKPQN